MLHDLIIYAQKTEYVLRHLSDRYTLLKCNCSYSAIIRSWHHTFTFHVHVATAIVREKL